MLNAYFFIIINIFFTYFKTLTWIFIHFSYLSIHSFFLALTTKNKYPWTKPSIALVLKLKLTRTYATRSYTQKKKKKDFVAALRESVYFISHAFISYRIFYFINF